MSMSKKDFVALANTMRALQPNMGILQGLSTPQAHAAKDGQQTQWKLTVEALADYCSAQNPRFNRRRWLDYIVGKCGPNGGRVK